MRLKVSKSSITITGTIAVLVILFSLLVMSLFGGKKSKVTAVSPTQASTGRDTTVKPAADKVTDTVKKAIETDKTVEQGREKGGYLSPMTPAPGARVKGNEQPAAAAPDPAKSPAKTPVKEPDKVAGQKPAARKGAGPEDANVADLRTELFGPPPATRPQEMPRVNQSAQSNPYSIYNQPAEPAGATGPSVQAQQQAAERDANRSREQLWARLYGTKVTGGFVGRVPGKETEPGEGQGQAQEAKSLGTAEADVSYYKPYTATVDRTLSAYAQAAEFVGTITQPGPYKGWKVRGRATPNGKEQRFFVKIASVVSPANKVLQATGYVSAIDDSDGVISKVIRDDIRTIGATAALAAASSFMDAMRKDTTETTATIVGSTAAQNKADDRSREASFAAGSSAFNDTKQKIDESGSKVPRLILEKGVPVLIYFTPPGN